MFSHFFAWLRDAEEDTQLDAMLGYLGGVILGITILTLLKQTRLLQGISVTLQDQQRMISAAVRREYAAAAAKEQTHDA